jgi:phage gp36-like protein
MFLEDADYKVVIGAKAFDVLKQSDDANLEQAEGMAIEEISGYLRPKYDLKTIFSATGDSRNNLIVMFCVDIALNNLVAAVPGRMGAETRDARYKRAVEWLTSVQKGSIVPDLPVLVSSETGEIISGSTSWGSKERNDNSW